MSKYFVKFNANPFGKNISDCAIRSTATALRIPYKEVCKRLRVAYKTGKGLVRDTGIDLYDLQEVFDEYFSNVENYNSESYERPDEFKDFSDPFYDDGEFDKDLAHNYTVESWMNLFAGTGRYLVGCTDLNRQEGHIVYVNTNNMKFYDTWDCSKANVDSYMKIKAVPKNNVNESERQNPNIHVAIFVNQGKNGQRFLDKIFSGEKKMETRAKVSGQRIEKLMSKYGDIDGQGIALVQKMKDGQFMVGYGKVKEIRYYDDPDSFYADSDLHLISKDDPEYAFDPKKCKCGIIFDGKPIKFKTPIPVDSSNPEDRRQRQSGYVELNNNEEDQIMDVEFTD